MKDPTENVSVAMPSNLLAVLDHFCREMDLSRSQAINRATRLYIGTKLVKTNSFWDKVYQELVNNGKLEEL